MALVKCKECNKEISSTAKQCPSCGYKIKKAGLFWPIIIGLMLIGYFFGDQEKSSKEVKVNNVKKINQTGRDNLQKQYWDPGYVESGFWNDKKFVIKIKSPPEGKAAEIYARVVCQQAKDNYNTSGFVIFIMGLKDQKIYGQSGCY
tara:strand:- start:45 stop:482 length:438 start_codon:yes stop_codon:yes gene_type:complete